MDAAAPAFLVALEASSLGLGIRQSPWVYPAANVGHVVSVVSFASAVVVLDLVLLGVLRVADRTVVLRRARGWAMALFALVVASGSVLFIAEASHLAMNRVFQIKLAVILVALANAAVLGSRAIRAAESLPDSAALPASVRAPAIVSLGLWLAVVGLGRFIAYL